MEAVLCILGFPSIPDLYRADRSASLLHPLLTRCDDKTSPDTVQCPSGTKLLPVAPLAASRFYVRGVFIENTWQEGLWAKRWGYDSKEGKCSSVFMELPSGGERKSPGRSQGSSGPITLRTCKPWKDPVISQYIVLSWPVAPSDKWGNEHFHLGIESFCSTGS